MGEAQHIASENELCRLLNIGGSAVQEKLANLQKMINSFTSYKDERISFKQRAKDLNLNFKMHYMDVPKDELFARLEQRNRQSDDETWYIPSEYLEQWYNQFEPPTPEELLG